MMRLPATPEEFLEGAVEPALALLPAGMTSDRARVMLVAIALQESALAHRWQIVDPKKPEKKGAARGLLQFERGGAVLGVLAHHASHHHARTVCQARGVNPTALSVYRRLEQDDVLAAAFGRLLLWTDPRALPAVGDESGAWEMYLRNWQPGAWTRGDKAQRAALRLRWSWCYGQAVAAVKTINAQSAASAGDIGDR